ncbi:RnfABCDGE type electron transport complex subunit D [Sporolactobacillus vineae]|uniref:RnfABCDGE type electron transport complex subunit D n=1 Tax=Sporolactobacillus vineae TaxID=444463 RepID=UPI000289B955|nr:RnfABCDGE type electron transport complex subunit D [Sporolactobacillus vineae]
MESSALNRVPHQIQVKRSDLRKSKKRKQGFSFQKFIKSPKGIVFVIILLLTMIGTAYPNNGRAGVTNLIAAVLTAVFFDFIIAYLLHRPKLFSDGALITGLIIGGILGPAVPWAQVMVTVIAALSVKHLFKDKRKPILNPAAIGLLVSSLLFSTEESWWSALSMLPAWATILLIAGGFVVVNRINKFPLVFAFMAAYIIFFAAAGLLGVTEAGNALRMPYINAALFLSFFMLTDPPTSPSRAGEQIFFGILAALCAGCAYLYLSKVTFMLIGLLLANAWKYLQARSRSAQRATMGRG